MSKWMNMASRIIRFNVVLLGIICCVCLEVDIYAKESVSKDKAVVFLLDASGSMNTNDRERLAIDSIAQFVYSLPSDYRIGFVAYNSDITASYGFVKTKKRNQLMSKAEKVTYDGYSNAGVGLEKAVNLLNKQEGIAEKYIVLLSDGEILMEDNETTKTAKAKYKKAYKTAKKSNIKIHVIGLEDEMEDEGNFIFSAAEYTGGKTYYTPKALKLQSAIDSILNNELQIKQSTAAIVDTDGGLEKVSVSLPYTYASKVRVLLTSVSPIKNLNTSFQAENATQVNGERYSLIELNHPTGDALELSFQGGTGSQVRINVIPEYRVTPTAEVSYRDEIPLEEEARYYNRTAEVVYSFHDADNEEVQLWTQDYFQHVKLALLNGEESKEFSLKEGTLKQEIKVETDSDYKTEIDYSNMLVNVIEIGDVEVSLEAPPELPVEEEPPYLLIAFIVFLVIVIVVVAVITWRKRRQKPLPLPPDDRPEPSKYSYVGKLSLYVTRTRSGYDIPPLSYSLFRLPAGKVVSLQEMFDSCNVKEEFAGAESIYFKPGANRSIIIINNSDCTIMKNREILLKNRSYQIPIESKLDITFEDEISELMLQYKDLKPSAMR